MRLQSAVVLLILESDESSRTRLEAAYREKAARWFWRESIALAEKVRRIGWDTPQHAAAAVRLLPIELAGTIFVYDEATKALT